MDVLSDALRLIRLKGAVFLNAEFREPWCVAAPSGRELARMHWPEHRHLAICHLIVKGKCWVSLPGRKPMAAMAGDAIALPHGDAHLLGSGARGAPVSASDALDVKVPNLARLRYGGTGAATRAICGWFAYESAENPVMAALPAIFRTGIRRRPSGAWLERSMRYAVEEAASGRPGAEAVANKLAEVLFVEALRGYIEALPQRHTGWLTALRDPLVGRSIALMHDRPAHAWTVASLAREVSTSRTVLAGRFAALVGTPPMQYLTRWRVALAAHLLQGDDALSLTRVAERIGYESEAAFSRAFRRQYGMPPGAWRREHGSRVISSV